MPLSVEDRLAILELAARYSHAFDYGDVDAWTQTFTEDGVLTDGERSATGREGLRAFAEGSGTGEHPTRHWTNNHVIEGDGDTATHSSYIMVLNKSGPIIIGVGIYHDKLKKVDGEWKFVRRHVTVEHTE